MPSTLVCKIEPSVLDTPERNLPRHAQSLVSSEVQHRASILLYEVEDEAGWVCVAVVWPTQLFIRYFQDERKASCCVLVSRQLGDLKAVRLSGRVLGVIQHCPTQNAFIACRTKPAAGDV